MESFEFDCPHCSCKHKFRLADSGKKASCTQCGQKMQISSAPDFQAETIKIGFYQNERLREISENTAIIAEATRKTAYIVQFMFVVWLIGTGLMVLLFLVATNR